MVLSARCCIAVLLLLVRANQGSEKPGCDLSSPEYAGFLMRTRVHYKHGIFELADVERVSRLLDRRSELLEVCPVAVLQALLVKLEENIIYEPRAYEDLMATYVRYLHAAISKGSINSEDLEQWPLTEGTERVNAVSQGLATPRNLTSAMVMNFCQARDRFGEMHELTWLLEQPFGHPNDGPDRGLLRQTDLFIYLVDKPWCSRPSESSVMKIRRAVRRLFLVPYTGGPEREEQTAYFKHLADHYENMHDFTIFVHPDAPEHQGAEFLALRRALKLIHTNSQFAHDAIGYFPLANQMVVDPKRTWGKKFAESWRYFYSKIFAPGPSWSKLGYVPPRCHWEAHEGTYLSGLLPGADERQSRTGAKAACGSSELCAGITCGTPMEDWGDNEEITEDLFLSPNLGRATCTARSGDSEGLFESPGNRETSYLKRCASASASILGSATVTAHDNGFVLERAAEAEAEDRGSAAAGLRTWETPQPAPDGAGDIFQFYTGSQSIVRKDKLLAWPQAQYQAWSDDGIFCSEYTGFIEAVWHAMFGEALAQWPRERDPRTPLYLKWSLGTMYSFGDEGVI